MVSKGYSMTLPEAPAMDPQSTSSTLSLKLEVDVITETETWRNR